MIINSDGTTKEPTEKIVETPKTSAHGMQAPTITLGNIFSRFPTTAGLSRAGQDYLNDLRKDLEDTSKGPQLRMIKLPTPPECYVFSKDDVGVIVVFSEAQNFVLQNQLAQAQQQQIFGVKQTEKEVYAGQSISLAMDTLRNIPDAPKRFAGSFIVTPEDYGRATKAADYIRATLAVATTIDYKTLGLGAFRDAKFSIDLNIERTEQYIDAVSPHQIMAAHSQGFLLKASLKDSTGAWGAPVPIAAVLSFTDPSPTQSREGGFGSNKTKYIPVVRITDVVSHIPLPFILDMAIVFASYIYCKCNMWHDQFTIYTKESINIGNLITDETGAPHNIKANEKEDFIRDFMYPPIITIDITEGRAWMYGAHLYMCNDDASNNMLINNFSNMLRIPKEELCAALNGRKIVQDVFSEYTGTIIMEGTTVDSRYLTYLRAVKKYAREQVLGLMYYNKKNVNKANIIRTINNSFIPLTETRIALIDVDFLVKLLNVFTNNLIVDVSNIIPNNLNGAYDFARASEQSKLFQTAQDFGMNTGFSSRNTGFNFSGSYTW